MQRVRVIIIETHRYSVYASSDLNNNNFFNIFNSKNMNLRTMISMVRAIFKRFYLACLVYLFRLNIVIEI